MPSAVEATGLFLSGIGGDEFMGGVPDPRAQLADLIVQFKFVKLTRQLIAWSLVKRQPWIHLLWKSAIDVLPSSLGQYFAKEAKIEPWIRKDFAKRTRLAIRQSDVDEHFGLWLPTRRSYIAGVLIMANNMAKLTAPVQAFEEARYPFPRSDPDRVPPLDTGRSAAAPWRKTLPDAAIPCWHRPAGNPVPPDKTSGSAHTHAHLGEILG